MNLSNKPTNTDSLRSELVELRARIDIKLKKLYLMRKLPYERLAKGRQLSILVDITIAHLDKAENVDLQVCLAELKKRGVKLKNI